MSAPPPTPPDKKRRLPLLPKIEVAAEGDEDRPPWHWSAIGAVGVFVFWFPLILAVNAVIPGPGAVWAGLNVAAFLIAAFGAGFIVGRFGGKAGRREAMVAGAAAGALAWLAAVTQGARAGILPWALLLAVIVAIGGGAARAGGALGVARRKAQLPG
jgi:tRNA-(ms[2]io[6]A)-hydroxylase